MVEDYDSIMKNQVWEVVLWPEEKQVVGSRWICKARFMAKGFSQKEGIDYEDTFALVARYYSIQTIITLVAEMGCRVHQMDVKTAFLNGVIQEEVFIEQPKGFDVENKETHVCMLQRALYGLKHAP